jgi:hypothetical protein
MTRSILDKAMINRTISKFSYLVQRKNSSYLLRIYFVEYFIFIFCDLIQIIGEVFYLLVSVS